MRWHAFFWQLIYADWSAQDIADGYGMRLAVVRAVLDEDLLADHEWIVSRGEAA
jgi:hypothetical protein